MKKAPNLWNLEHLMADLSEASMAQIGESWVPSRPLGFYSLWSRLNLAWMVFTGKADALLWPGGQ